MKSPAGIGIGEAPRHLFGLKVKRCERRTSAEPLHHRSQDYSPRRTRHPKVTLARPSVAYCEPGCRLALIGDTRRQPRRRLCGAHATEPVRREPDRRLEPTPVSSQRRRSGRIMKLNATTGLGIAFVHCFDQLSTGTVLAPYDAQRPPGS